MEPSFSSSLVFGVFYSIPNLFLLRLDELSVSPFVCSHPGIASSTTSAAATAGVSGLPLPPGFCFLPPPQGGSRAGGLQGPGNLWPRGPVQRHRLRGEIQQHGGEPTQHVTAAARKLHSPVLVHIQRASLCLWARKLAKSL